ncbi:hypothetical protein CWI39_0093p0020 [Hamiltosporidium magnivora]|uniref:Uncharacterized protein n=1 Tax=Hamiltosporidium magnivora TaxID=148818 RepID=A0A4Q9LLL5_9MICR|nr:hypothetical protein CWI39_0093p0020 [Hamiltosporidium magnivora]
MTPKFYINFRSHTTFYAYLKRHENLLFLHLYLDLFSYLLDKLHNILICIDIPS